MAADVGPTRRDAAPAPLNTRRRALSATGWAAVTMVLTAPMAVAPLGPMSYKLDNSWVIGLAMASRQHLHWGSQVIFPYGPLGFLASTDYVFFSRWLLAAIFVIGLHVLLVLAFLALLWRSQASRWMWLLTTVVAFAPSMLGVTPEREGPLVAIIVLFFALDEGRETTSRTALTCAAAALLAFLSLVKISLIFEALPILCVYTALCLTTSRRFTAATGPIAFAICFVAVWIAAGQRLEDIPAFLEGGWNMTSGYTAAMSLHGITVLAALGFLVVVAAVVAACVSLRAGDKPLSRMLFLLTPMLVLGFKEGFVRDDTTTVEGHAAIFVAELLFAALVVAIVGRPRVSGTTRWVRGALFGSRTAILACGAMLMATSVGFRADVYPTVFSSYGLTWSLLSDARTRASFAFQSHYVLRNSVVIPEADLAGRRVDIMPWDIVDAYVYSLTWDPRPVMQSYAAFTPYLDGRDAEFFNGTAAPDRILYILESIDTRYQAFDEPATFRVLLERYWAYNEVSNDALVLSRRASPLSGTVRSEGRQCVDVGSSIAIPQIPDRYVFAAVSVHLSIFGQLKTWVFKPGWLTITLDVPGELTSPHRFVSAVGLDGLFVSSSMDTAQDVTAAFRGKFTKPIKALTVDSTDRGDYNTTVCADFTSIPAPVGS